MKSTQSNYAQPSGSVLEHVKNIQICIRKVSLINFIDTHVAKLKFIKNEQTNKQTCRFNLILKQRFHSSVITNRSLNVYIY